MFFGSELSVFDLLCFLSDWIFLEGGSLWLVLFCCLWLAILSYFFLITVLGCMLSYLSVDPMKSSFFLVFSMLTGMPLLSFFLNVWFSYFICLLFLSGIFVILVYFSSLSKLSILMSPWFWFIGLLIVLFFYPNVSFVFSGLTLVNFYYDVYWYLFVWIVFSLVFFMNFTSYFISFSGALRKI